MEANRSDLLDDNSDVEAQCHITRPACPYSVRQRLIETFKVSHVGRKAHLHRFLVALAIITIIASLCSLAWYILLLDLDRRLALPIVRSGYQMIVQDRLGESQGSDLQPRIENNSSNGITPIPCHSHNDNERSVPLFEALAAGCTGIEADIWADASNPNGYDLLVGHSRRYLKSDRSLASLYINPLIKILDEQNQNVANGSQAAGVYASQPNTTLVLMLDFKEDGAKLWPLVQKNIDPFREKGYLRHWNGKDLIPGPITIVGSGSASFDLITANETYRDIFFDAPLDKLGTSDIYDTTNSYYASVSMTKSIGRLWTGRFSTSQISLMKSQIKVAEQKGLVSRYWATPAWPISWRTYVWKTLVDLNVGMLNVDDLVTASRWNWDWCVVAGITVCGS